MMKPVNQELIDALLKEKEICTQKLSAINTLLGIYLKPSPPPEEPKPHPYDIHRPDFKVGDRVIYTRKTGRKPHLPEGELEVKAIRRDSLYAGGWGIGLRSINGDLKYYAPKYLKKVETPKIIMV